MIKKSLFGIGLVALAAVGCNKGGGDGIGSGEVLAVVNGSEISMNEYFKTMERKSRITAVVNPRALSVDQASGQVLPQVSVVEIRPSMAFQALQECVANEIIRQVAKDEGVFPSATDIENEIKLEEERNPKFVQDISRQGLTIDQIKSQIGLSLARLNLQTKGVTVKDEEIEKYITDNPQQFTQPASADLLYMEVADEKNKGLADKELKEGQMFAAVAQHYSVPSPNRDQGFKYPTSVIDQMPAALKKLVSETKEFTASKWVKDDGTGHWVKFYVAGKKPAAKIPINNYIRQMVKRELLRKQGSRNNDPDKRVAEKLKTSKIEIKVKYLSEPWEQAFKELTKAQETPATPEAGK